MGCRRRLDQPRGLRPVRAGRMGGRLGADRRRVRRRGLTDPDATYRRPAPRRCSVEDLPTGGRLSPPGSKTPKLVTVIHIDHHTAVDTTSPRWSCCPSASSIGSSSAHRSSPSDVARPATATRSTLGPAIEVALQGHVRFAAANEQGIPIAWGRQRRLFSGPARQAVTSLSSRCTHPGCRVRAGRSQADHTVEYSRGGLTDPDNGGPPCRRHNNAKNEGFAVWRDPMGAWHTYRPDGTEIP